MEGSIDVRWTRTTVGGEGSDNHVSEFPGGGGFLLPCVQPPPPRK